MKHILLCLSLLFAVVAISPAQDAAAAAKSQEIVSKMRQIDLLNQIIPLALTKDQINKLLPFVERARSKVLQVQKDEAQTLVKLEGKVNAAIKKSIDTQVAPPKELLKELADTTMHMSLNRQAAVDDNTAMVLKVFNDTCNAGQKKAAANSLAPQLLDPSLKPDQMTQDDKVRFFVQEIFLDPLAYDLLLKLAK